MYKLTIILLSLIAGTAFSASSNNVLRNTELNILQLMVDTRDQQRANPEQSLACFDYYLKVLDDHNEEYRLGFAACLDEADDKRSNVDAATQPERDEIEQSAKTSCEALNVCAKLVGSVDYFSCFSSTGKESTESMYEISANAGESLAKVREEYRVIESAEYRCTNATERLYVEKTYKTNQELQSCLRGESSVPTTVAPPEVSTSNPETTPAPVETTPETTVVPGEPETTPAPVETTPETTGVPGEPETTPAPVETTPESTVVPGEPETTPAPVETTPESTVVPGEPETTPAPVETTPESTMVPAEPETTPAPVETTPESTVVPGEPETTPAPEPEATTESDFMPEEDLFAMRKLLARLKSRLALSKH
ncbi:protein TsetseEP-like isoform X2 [Zeugodacus cucurbitae]|uniref:protein TsetseEP-like isoform X2 n=1 Tax=Zeugodacus cucurbitae TaxID=28588 RepID=UPI0023D95383|nr:protein TsetseEP-like isoform X2 [Zeugodacus cucurbitae]